MDWECIYLRLAADRDDALAWRALERRVEAWARAVFASRPHHLIGEAVVDTCAAIALGIEAARGAETFAGFAYGHFLNARRRLLRGLQAGNVPIDGIDLAAPAEDDGLDAAALAHLRSAVAGLPPRERAAVTLRYFEDLPSARIAAELGVSNINARRIVCNGLRRLRAQLRDPDPLGGGSGRRARLADALA
jgi:RNA polymerase sigma factor (sigma-70 family)